MWAMLQHERPDDYVIATGTTRPLQEFVDLAFREVGLDWRAHVETDPGLFRPSDLAGNWANPAKAERVLGWKAAVPLEETVRRMVAAELELQGDGR
jgi:GDPmannose 4,6-dehydratase